MHDPTDCKKNPEYNDNEEKKEKKVSFAAKLSKILAQEDSDDDE